MTNEAKERKRTPIFSGVLRYFPDAIADVAKCSRAGNDQHNPGTDLHWDRSKSGDELDALSRHLMDAGTLDSDGIRHSAKVAWRALANLQKEIERERQEEWEEEMIERSKEDQRFSKCNKAMFEYDGECSGELGSHPLCCTDYCPCKEDEIESRMNIIGQNGNTGEHYDEVGESDGKDDRNSDISNDLSSYPSGNITSSLADLEVDYVEVAVSDEKPCGWDNTKKNINSPENVVSTMKIGDATVTYTNGI